MSETSARGALDHVRLALSGIRAGAERLERDIHARIAEALRAAGIQHSHEVPIGPRCRVDFLTNSGVAIEVKAGKTNSRKLWSQAARYARCGSVEAVLIVAERGVFKWDREIDGVPVDVLSLSEQWGVAL